jgi:rubrerythrin
LGPSPDDLRHICDEEVEHFKLLQHAITELGGDPTVQTPSADVAGVLSHGVIQIVSDPRSSIAQTLQAMLTAELADNDGWEMLGEVAGETGYDELAKKCEKAFAEEQEHLENVRGWLTELTLTEVAGDGSFAEEAGVAKERKASGQDSKRSKRGKRSQKRGTTKRRKK